LGTTPLPDGPAPEGRLPGAALLSVRDLRVHRGPLLVVDGVSLDVAQGRCLGLVGLNGAGKSSLLACLAGILLSSSGTVTLDGADVTGRPSWERCRAGLTLVPSGRHLFGSLTVTDNLLIGGHLCRDRRARHAAVDSVFGIFPVLADKRGQRAGELSGGQQQMLAIGRGLMAAPRVLLLDEPSEGLAPIVVEQVFDAITELKRTAAMAILLAEQNARVVDVCDELCFIREGVVSAQEPSQAASAADVKAYVFGQ